MSLELRKNGDSPKTWTFLHLIQVEASVAEVTQSLVRVPKDSENFWNQRVHTTLNVSIKLAILGNAYLMLSHARHSSKLVTYILI